jgi:hypothetical protein
MEYSSLDEIYGGGSSATNIKTNGNNMSIPKRDINKEQNFHFGAYQESAKQRSPQMANQSQRERHSDNRQEPVSAIPSSPESGVNAIRAKREDDLASIISDTNTVVIGGGTGTSTGSNPDDIGPIPGYASPRQFATINETITSGLIAEQLGSKPVERAQELETPSLFEQILEKMNELLTRVDYNEQEEKRSSYEIMVHIGLYFLTGLFILYLLYYVFSLGKQNIKISLVK